MPGNYWEGPKTLCQRTNLPRIGKGHPVCWEFSKRLPLLERFSNAIPLTHKGTANGRLESFVDLSLLVDFRTEAAACPGKKQL
jgi:hypothetical protein